MADQAKGKEDEEDGEDYSKVIEVLKQYIKSYKRVIASRSSNIKTLFLSLNTLKASIKDSVRAIKNISSTLASLTNSSNAATTGKTSYSPRFDPFSSTMDLDSPLRPPRKEPYLGPAVNSATSNLDPPMDIGSKEGLKDTITSSIVKELSKQAYTIPDDKEFRNLAIEAYRVAYIANSSNSTPNSRSYNLAIEEEEEEESNSSSNSSSSSDSNTEGDRRCIAILDFKKSGFFLDVKGSSKPILHINFAFPLGLTSYNTSKSIELQRNKIVGGLPSNSIQKEDYLPIKEDAIVSEAIEPKKRYKPRNSPAKGTTLEGIGPSLRGKRPCRPIKPLATA
ncbi:hypothetical protein P8C59_006514 [Phyllachora maydis]|uniref:Uncharacterized protein n=1 Tax=Phyllachora maydis TaxID=1825666 RepID=A0AAD9I8A2_9PEZI|nr:hypothetical protein P8C59_006514 [Phyllachora maydis]